MECDAIAKIIESLDHKFQFCKNGHENENWKIHSINANASLSTHQILLAKWMVWHAELVKLTECKSAPKKTG